MSKNLNSYWIQNWVSRHIRFGDVCQKSTLAGRDQFSSTVWKSWLELKSSLRRTFGLGHSFYATVFRPFCRPTSTVFERDLSRQTRNALPSYSYFWVAFNAAKDVIFSIHRIWRKLFTLLTISSLYCQSKSTPADLSSSCITQFNFTHSNLELSQFTWSIVLRKTLQVKVLERYITSTTVQ